MTSRPAGLAVGALTRHRVHNRGLTFHTAGWDPRVEAMLAFGVYESAEIRLIRAFLRGTQNAIELGGSLGIAGSHLLQVMAHDGHLVSVEANSALIPILRTTLLAHADGRVTTVIHAAVSTDATAFVSVSENNLSSQLAASGIEVPTLSLSAISAQADFQEFALVSDIEGAETSFIFNPGELNGCTRMVIELHDASHDGRRVTSAEMAEEIQRQGFSLVDQRGNVCAFTRQPTGRDRA